MKGKERREERGRSHSERAGEAVLGSGERAALYRALRELSCSRCGGVIREGDLFTREAEPASELPLLRRCRGCVPFKVGGGLLDALLAPEGGGEPSPAVAAGDVRRKVMSRLGPALDAGRSRARGEAIAAVGTSAAAGQSDDAHPPKVTDPLKE